MLDDLRTLCLPLVLAALPFAPSAAAQSCASGPPGQLGTVTELAESCTGGVGNLPGTTCRVLRISCDGIPDIEVELRITQPHPAAPMRGTVMFGVGGGGVGFYANKDGGEEMVAAARNAGFRVIDRSWRTSWFGDDFGVRKQSCRYATLLFWVHDNLHTTGAFCASGNSGGSGELTYSLTTWGSDAILDVAVPTGGPPMARLDLLCGGTPGWQDQCEAVVPPNVMTCGQPDCLTQPNHQVCVACSPTATLQELRQDSVLHPNAVLDFPTTQVHSILGTEDCGSAVPAAMLFFNAVESEKILSFAPGAPHFVPTTAEGRQAILRALLQGAACDTGPATLTAQGWPQIGGPFVQRAFGPAGAPYSIFYSLDTALFEIGTLGWAFLGQPFVLLGGGALNPQGIGPLTVQIPNVPGIVGLDVYTQAVIDVCLSNLVHVQLLP